MFSAGGFFLQEETYGRDLNIIVFGQATAERF